MDKHISIAAKKEGSTDKAWLLETEYGKDWWPKSKCRFDEASGLLTAPAWLVEKKGE